MYEKNDSVMTTISSELLQQQTAAGDSNTVGILMVPTQNIAQFTGGLQNRGNLLDSNFQGLRGGDRVELETNKP